jgi:hypothetical protein
MSIDQLAVHVEVCQMSDLLQTVISASNFWT